MSSLALPSEVSILIVGAGPTGLALACALLNKGVPSSSVLIVEKESLAQKQARQHQSRALGINARTLECLEETVDDSLAPPPSPPTESKPCNTFTMEENIKSTVQAILDRALVVRRMATREPGRAKALLTSDFALIKDETRYPFMIIHPQASTESILQSRFHTLGGTLYREWCLESFDFHGDPVVGRPVTVKLLHSTGARAEIQTKILVGADGGRSAVRVGAMIDFPGYSYPETFVLGDVKFKSNDWMEGPKNYESFQFLSQAGWFMLAPLPDGVVRVVADDRNSTKPGKIEVIASNGHTSARKVPSQAELQALVISRGPRLAAGDDRNTITTVTWASRFHLSHRIVPTFIKGSVCLIGDAAHLHSPAGGQGMNLGIQDAASLGLVLSGFFQTGSLLNSESAKSLTQRLEAWSTKRHRIASQVLIESNQITRMRTMRNPILIWLRSRLLPLLGFFPVLLRRQMRKLMGLYYR